MRNRLEDVGLKKGDGLLKKFGLMMGALSLFILILTGCDQQPEPVDEILSIYEWVAQGESVLADLNQQKQDLMGREKELRGLIIYGGADSNLAVLSLIEEMIESIQSRQGLMEEQIRIMEETKEELEAANLLIEAISAGEIREMFLHVQALHQERYETFMELAEHYLETTREELRFYALLQEEEQSLRDLESITIELNQRAIIEDELQEALSQVSVRLNAAINVLARGLEERESG